MPADAVIRALHRRLRDSEDGFTLTEMLVVLAILGIIMAAMTLVLSTSITSSSQIQEQSVLQSEVRGAVDSMTREIRQAYTGDDVGGTYPIVGTPTTTSLQFMSPDRAAPFHNRLIAYRLAGGQLDRALTTSTNTTGWPWVGFAWTAGGTVPSASWKKQVGSVANSAVFTYYDKAGALLTGTITPSSVYRVNIAVTVATKAAATRQYTYSTSAALRWEPE